jgi:hypothetical protein
LAHARRALWKTSPCQYKTSSLDSGDRPCVDLKIRTIMTSADARDERIVTGGGTKPELDDADFTEGVADDKKVPCALRNSGVAVICATLL